MKKKSCHLEREVMDCLKANKLSLEIKKHLSECQLCKDVVYAYGWISKFKEKSWNVDMPGKTLPDPELVWNRAYSKRRPDKELVKKALRPLIYARVFSYLVLIIGAVFLFLSNTKEIGKIIYSGSAAGPVLDSSLKIITQSLPLFIIPMTIVFISFFFCLLVVSFEKRKKVA